MSRPLHRSFILAALAALAIACSGSSSTQQLGPPAALAIDGIPASATAGSALGSVSVRVVDGNGNTVTTSAAQIELAVASGPSGATLSGQSKLAATAGVATFTDLSLDKAGTYTLTASGAGVDAVESAAFTVAPGAPSSMKFQGQPGNAVVGGTFGTPVSVALFDALGNASTASGVVVTLKLASNPSGAHLGGTATVASADGIASFPDLSVDTPGIGYTLTASASGLTTSSPSSPFDVHAATHFVYVDPPDGTKLRLVKDPASTDSTIVLDLVTTEALSAYAVALDLPMDRSRVQPNATLLIPGGGLDPGTNPVAAAAGLPSSGARSGVLAVGITQKAAGSGAVASDAAIASGTTLFTVQLDVGGSGLGGTVFDGAALGPAFRAALLDKAGNSVATNADFGIGKLSLE